jgi:16S rRNA (adenine1518-N6/adenine1519-N6)-dimethyltransferase
VLLHLLAALPSIERVLVMVQAEVGHRIAAPPGSKVYGGPSVKAAWYGDWRVAGTISRQVFWPVPNVDSVIVGMHGRHVPGDERLRARTFQLVDAAFGQRRKMLRQALAEVFGSSAAATAALEAAGVDPTARGEQLGLDAFLSLARVGVE